jgi:Fur family transcriptional regulator, ferric uptake regulator
MIRSPGGCEGWDGRRRCGSGTTTQQEEPVTVPAHTALVAAPDLDSALHALRARGLRLSSARRRVLGVLFAAGLPLTADEVARRSGPPAEGGCDLASVYRNLEVLEDAGVVRHLHVGHGPGLYLPAADATELVVCERCGARADIDPRVTADVRAAVLAATGFTPRFDHFPLAGLCPRCRHNRAEED